MTTTTTDIAKGRGDIYGDIYYKPKRMTIVMRDQGWRDLLDRRHIKNDQVLASLLGFTPSSVYRLRKGHNRPSGDFIAQALVAFAEHPLDDADFDVDAMDEQALAELVSDRNTRLAELFNELFEVVPRSAVAKAPAPASEQDDEAQAS